MVMVGTDGFQIPFPALVEFLIFMGCKGVNLPLQTVGSVCGEKFLQELSPHLCSIPDGPRPHRVEPNFGLVLQSQRKFFSLIRSRLVASSLKVL